MKKIFGILATILLTVASGSTQTCVPTPSGLAAWWPGEGIANDVISGSNGVVYAGTTYSNGIVGQCFSFDGATGCVMTTNTPALTSIQNNFTIEFWAYPKKAATLLPEGGGLGISGQSYAIFPDWGGTGGPAGVGVSVGTNGIMVFEHAYNYLPAEVSYTNSISGWVHVAVVYTNKQPTLFVNGTYVRTGVTSTRSYVYPSKNLGGSYAVAGGFPVNGYGPYAGLLDEVSIYNHALTATDIAAIYNAGSAGKCGQSSPSAPLIVGQPASQTNLIGTTAIFNIDVLGSSPLSLQWTFNGTNLTGATGATLTLTNVQVSQAGNYSVLVTNLYGATNSATAVLTVNALPPTITLQPTNQTVLAGTNVTFVSGAAGSAPLKLQWTFNGSNRTGATNATLTLTNVQLANAGSYSLLVTNLYGATNSATAALTVNVLTPSFTLQPTSQTVLAGANVTFTSGVAGTAPLKLQWTFNGTNLTGATNATLTLANVQPVNAGNYSLVVTNLYGATNSATAVLTVNVLTPFITLQPTNQTVLAGANVTFTGGASGTAPLSYQWIFSGTNLPGATNATLTLTNVQPGTAGSFSLQVSNPYGTTNSATAVLTVNVQTPFITLQPVSQNLYVGNTVTLSGSAGGTAPLTYQWTCNGTNLTGATSTNLTLTNLQLANTGIYSLVVTNPYGSTNSTGAVLTVSPIPPCTTAPSGLIGWWSAEGNAKDLVSGTYGTLYSGTGYTNGESGQGFSFDGASGCVMTTNTPSLTNVQNTFTIEFWANPAKSLTFMPEGGGLGTSGQSYAVFPEWGGDTTRAGVGVSVGTNGIMVVEHTANYMPSALSYTNYINGWVHIAVVYTNKQPVLYLNGVKVRTGVTSPENYVYPSKNFGSSYDGSAGAPLFLYGPYKGLLDEISIYSRALGATEIAAIYSAGPGGKCVPAPTIVTQPTNQTVLTGSTATFAVAATGLQTLSYQWSFNGTNLAAATNATLVLANVQTNQTGLYAVVVSDNGGPTYSSNAMLMVVYPPIITAQPVSQTVMSYNSASFTVTATGSALSYQWQKNGSNLTDGANISGSTTPSLNLATVGITDAGNYSVIVSNPFLATNSAVAVLTVPQTAVTPGSTNAMSGSVFVVPVLMNALGVENTFLASVDYDPTKLALQSVQLGAVTSGAYLQEVDTQTNNGHVGFAILLNTGDTIPVGTQEVADLIFTALSVTNTTSVNITFGDTPTGRQVVDNNLNLLPALYATGTVVLIPAEYCADVYPRFIGDHNVNVQDWLEVGRMVAGLDTPTNSDELLRADCAPRNAPDGSLSIADWVQAGRYALGLDPLTLVTLPATTGDMAPTPLGGPTPTRTLQLGNVAAQRGQSLSVPVQLVCTTNENAAGLTVLFNANQLKLTGVSLGSAMSGGRLNVNTNVGAGKLGIALALSPGAALTAGTNQLAQLQFLAATNASGVVNLMLDSSVVKLQVADKTANVLPTTYVNGTVTLPAQPTLGTAKTGSGLQLSWPLATGTFQVQTANSLFGPWTTIALPVITNGANATVTVSPTNQQQYYRLSGQ